MTTIKRLLKFLLSIAIILTSICCLSTLVLGRIESYGINYISGFIIIYILLFSLITLILLAFTKKSEAWNYLKKEVVLFVVALGLLLLLSLLTTLSVEMLEPKT